MSRWWMSALWLLIAVSAQAFPTFPSTYTLGIDPDAETPVYQRYTGIVLGNYQKGVAVFDISEARRLAAQGERIFLNFYLSWDWDDFTFPINIFVFPGHNASNDDFTYNATQAPPEGTIDFSGPYGWEALAIDGSEHAQKFEARAEGCTFDFRDKYPYSACHFEPYSVDVTAWITDPRLTTGEFGSFEPYMGVLFHMLETDDGIVTVTSLPFTDNLDDYGLLKAGLNLDTKPLQRMVLPSDRLQCDGEDATVVGTFNDDTLILTGDGQVVVSFDGSDRIVGSEGNDKICPGHNNNIVYGNGGNDTIRGGGLSETFFGGSGNDTIEGGGGSNLLVGAGGNDRLIASENSQNVLRGGSGDDVLLGNMASACDGGNSC